MEWYEVGLGLLGLLMVLIAIGLPIPFALAAASLPFLWQIQSFQTSLVSSQLKLWGVWIDYILLAVPLFVFLGELIGKSRIGPNLYQFLHQGVRIRGSAAYGSIGACAGFGAVCGSSMVGALTIGGVALPEMLRLGYGKRLSAGVLAAGGTLSVLIPPSLILLFYGIVTDQSIGDLFIAGVIPGLVLVSAFVGVVLVWGILRPQDIPDSEDAMRMTLMQILATVGPILLIGLVITVAIYAGIATPTEAAAVAALLTVALAFGVGGLTWQGFKEALFATMRTMGYLGLLMSAAGFDLIWFGVVYTITMEIAVLTPPVGLNLYVIQGIGRGQVTIGDVIMGCLPFIGALVALIALLILWPETALWLPDQMR